MNQIDITLKKFWLREQILVAGANFGCGSKFWLREQVCNLLPYVLVAGAGLQPASLRFGCRGNKMLRAGLQTPPSQCAPVK
jgi:hypothetical protein